MNTAEPSLPLQLAMRAAEWQVNCDANSNVTGRGIGGHVAAGGGAGNVDVSTDSRSQSGSPDFPQVPLPSTSDSSCESEGLAGFTEDGCTDSDSEISSDAHESDSGGPSSSRSDEQDDAGVDNEDAGFRAKLRHNLLTPLHASGLEHRAGGNIIRCSGNGDADVDALQARAHSRRRLRRRRVKGLSERAVAAANADIFFVRVYPPAIPATRALLRMRLNADAAVAPQAGVGGAHAALFPAGKAPAKALSASSSPSPSAAAFFPTVSAQEMPPPSPSSANDVATSAEALQLLRAYLSAVPSVPFYAWFLEVAARIDQ